MTIDDRWINRYIDIYYEELAHTVMEADVQDLLSESWRLWKPVNDVIQSNTKALRSRKANGENLSPKVGKDEIKCPNLAARQKRGANSFFLHLLYYSGPQQIG